MKDVSKSSDRIYAADSRECFQNSCASVLLVVVTPIPILLLLIGRTLVEIDVAAMCFSLPLIVVDGFAVPIVIVVVIGVVDACVDGAAGDKKRRSERRAKRECGEVLEESVHTPFHRELDGVMQRDHELVALERSEMSGDGRTASDLLGNSERFLLKCKAIAPCWSRRLW